jgi:hypothetical protein
VTALEALHLKQTVMTEALPALFVGSGTHHQ